MPPPPYPPFPVPDELFTGPFAAERRHMVREDLWQRDIRDLRVLEAMARVPRHEFLPPAFCSEAYADRPLGIGFGQTISQPYIVAKMSELASVGPGSRVLEIGVGSGYQTAVLLELGAEVHGLEIIAPLAENAQATLTRLGYRHFQITRGDGFSGLPEAAPFQAILVAAAPERVPPGWMDQLAAGGRLVVPVGPLNDQYLYVYTPTEAGCGRINCGAVRFVPMTGAILGESEPGELD